VINWPDDNSRVSIFSLQEFKRGGQGKWRQKTVASGKWHASHFMPLEEGQNVLVILPISIFSPAPLSYGLGKKIELLVGRIAGQGLTVTMLEDHLRAFIASHQPIAIEALQALITSFPHRDRAVMVSSLFDFDSDPDYPGLQRLAKRREVSWDTLLNYPSGDSMIRKLGFPSRLERARVAEKWLALMRAHKHGVVITMPTLPKGGLSIELGLLFAAYKSLGQDVTKKPELLAPDCRVTEGSLLLLKYEGDDLIELTYLPPPSLSTVEVEEA
jgi:hypothetical protein